jgi:CBS domain-containing protein
MSFQKMRKTIPYSFDFHGNNALRKNSPYFFKKFNVEEGINRDKFDIKTRALIPLIDGADFTLYFDIN